jgi:uncharacterized protein YkwD
MRRATMLALVFGALFSGWTNAAGACDGADKPPSSQTAEEARRAVTCLINRRRDRHDLRPVHGDVALGVAAQGHSEAMVGRDFFSHGGDGTPPSRARAAGYLPGAESGGLGENLAWGSGNLGTPRATVEGWMESREHREIILARRFRDIGVGVGRGSPAGPDDPGTATYAAVFGFRARL